MNGWDGSSCIETCNPQESDLSWSHTAFSQEVLCFVMIVSLRHCGTDLMADLCSGLHGVPLLDCTGRH